jgi:sec-independent protein translocase protein TatB
MPTLGPLEIMVVLAIALVVLGPRKLPEMARYLGKAYGLIRRTTYELKNTLDQELLDEDRQARREAAEGRREQYRRKRLEKDEPQQGEQVGEPKTASEPEAAPEPASEPPEGPASDEGAS